MLRWAFNFFVLAFIAALVGFQGQPLRWIAPVRLLFFAFLGLFALSFGLGLLRGGNRRSIA